MKKLTHLLFFLTLTFMINAQVYLDEKFNYSVTNLADELTWTHAITGWNSY
jgi:hypothetical protein